MSFKMKPTVETAQVAPANLGVWQVKREATQQLEKLERRKSTGTAIKRSHSDTFGIKIQASGTAAKAGPSSHQTVGEQSQGSTSMELATRTQAENHHLLAQRYLHRHRRSTGNGKVLTSRVENEKSGKSAKQRYLEEDYYQMQMDVLNPLPPTYHEFKMRKKSHNRESTDCISTMPDEVLLRVFKLLPKRALASMARTSHRFLRLVEDDSLWKRMCVMGRMLQPENLLTILERKPMYLRLARAEIPDPPNGLPRDLLTQLASSSQLTYLDLTSAMISPETLALIMKVSPKIVKLSLEHLRVTKDVLQSMMPLAAKMEELNLTMCYDLDPTTLSCFLLQCQNLKQLNLGCISASHWSRNDLTTVTQSLPSSLQYLNISGFRNLLDNGHVEDIVTRCPGLIELDVSDSAELNAKCMMIIVELKHVQHLSFSRCYGIEPTAYNHLQFHPTLQRLNLFSLFNENSLRHLSGNLKGIEMNKFPISIIARPTVGNKRSSIWFQRVRV